MDPRKGTETLALLVLRMSPMRTECAPEPQGFTMDEYNEPAGLVGEIIKTGVELM